MLRNREQGVAEILVTLQRHYNNTVVRAVAHRCLACVLAETKPVLMYCAYKEELKMLWDPMPLFVFLHI